MRHSSGMIIQSDGSKPYTVSVMKALADMFPYVIQRMGGMVVREVRGKEGTGQMSWHSFGRAIDIYLRVAEPHEKALGTLLFDMFRDNADVLKTSTVIFNYQASSGGDPATSTATAGVRDPHTDHVHVDFLESAINGSAAGIMPAYLIMVAAKFIGFGYGDYQTGWYGPAYNPDARGDWLTSTQRRAINNYYKNHTAMDISLEYLQATKDVQKWVSKGKLTRPAGIPERT